MDDLVRRLRANHGDCRECGARETVIWNGRGQFVCEACLLSIIPYDWQVVSMEAADAIEALTARAEAAEAQLADSRNRALEDAVAGTEETLAASRQKLVEMLPRLANTTGGAYDAMLDIAATQIVHAAIRALKSDPERG